jgi:hypothetical protein
MGGKHHPRMVALLLGSPHYSSMFHFKFLRTPWHHVSLRSFAVHKSHAFRRELASLSDLKPFWLQTDIVRWPVRTREASASCWAFKKPGQSDKWVTTHENPEIVWFQWEFQDPIDGGTLVPFFRPYFVGIFPYIARLKIGQWWLESFRQELNERELGQRGRALWVWVNKFCSQCGRWIS